jgi:RNA-directed DNA polymerase
MPNEERPTDVTRACGSRRAGDIDLAKWDWVERTVWTVRMLKALERGKEGGVWHSLVDKVYRKTTLRRAFELVQANRGAAGSDRQTIRQFAAKLDEEIDRLHEELRSGSYRPRPIRRVWIDKPGRKEKRPLGVPAVRDRVVQAAVRMAIEPIFETEFAEHSYGFRPRRGAKDALRRVDALLKAGYTWVVDADLKGYFDSIPQGRLMADVQRRIADGRLLSLLEAFLSQPVMEGLECHTPTSGTPQGAVLSPLLANLYLHPLDAAAREAGFEMVRYADDFVILCRTRAEAEAALDLVRRVCAERGLCLHPDKTRLVREDSDEDDDGPPGFDFLGYRFQEGRRCVRQASLLRLRDTLRRKTPRNSGSSLEAIIADCNRTLRGWFEYFKHSRPSPLTRLDQWLRRRLRSLLRKRTKRRGISKGLDHQRWPNDFFRERGLFFLADARRACLQSARG